MRRSRSPKSARDTPPHRAVSGDSPALGNLAAYLDEQRSVLRIGERATTTADADAHSARKVAETTADTRPEDSIACSLLGDGQRLRIEILGLIRSLDFGLQDDGDDHPIDGDSLAKDDAAIRAHAHASAYGMTRCEIPLAMTVPEQHKGWPTGTKGVGSKTVQASGQLVPDQVLRSDPGRANSRTQ